MCRDLWNWQTKNPLGYDTPEPTPALVIEPTATQVTEPVAVAANSSSELKSKNKEDKEGEQAQVAESG